MSAAKPSFRHPQLRPGVAIRWTHDAVALEYRQQSCDIECPPEVQSELGALLALLKRGAPTSSLAEAAPAFAPQLQAILDDLDRLGLIVEGDVATQAGGMTGSELCRRVKRLADTVRGQYAKGEFYNSLVQGTTTREQLIGYAIEYFHIVSMAPRLIAAALSHEGSPRTQRLLQEFLVSELGHDRLLARSLASVGIDEDRLRGFVPLSSTFAICSALGVFAAQDPCTFKSVLFVYEDVDDRFSVALQRRCAELGLPPGFVEPILTHAAINDGGGHADISQQLLDDVAYVGSEQASVVMKHVAVLVETLVKAERDILHHYAALPAAAFA